MQNLLGECRDHEPERFFVFMTVYNLLSEVLPKSALTEKNMEEIGIRISKSAKELNVNINKVKQVEHSGTFIVNDYPDEFKPRMEKIAFTYFNGLSKQDTT